MGIGGEDGTKRVEVLNDAVDDVDVAAADVVAVTVEVVEGGKRV